MWCCVVEDPGIMKKFRVDRGAIKFVLAGANIMCPGLTSAGGDLDEDVPVDSPVVGGLNLPLWPDAGIYLSGGGGRFWFVRFSVGSCRARRGAWACVWS
jgi:hypothetical protein